GKQAGPPCAAGCTASARALHHGRDHETPPGIAVPLAEAGRAVLSVGRQMPAPVLFILHQEHSTPGRVAQILKSQGYTFDIRRPRFGDPLPETLAGHSGAVIFGG